MPDLIKVDRLTYEQARAAEIARIGAMSQAPFFAHFYKSTMEDYPTLDLPTAGTDSNFLYYNPPYLVSLQPKEMIFVWVHELMHAVYCHPQRIEFYINQGHIRNMIFSPQLFNICADFVINANLVENEIGQINGAWLYDPKVTGGMLVEDVYEMYYRPPPPASSQPANLPRNPVGSQPSQPQPDNSGSDMDDGTGVGIKKPLPTKGHGRGQERTLDKTAARNQGRFDEVKAPPRDPVTGKVKQLSPGEFRQAISNAAEAAKQMGKLPGYIERYVKSVLEPQISWREEIRLLVLGRLGYRGETWNRPNRRRIVLNPVIYLPGRSGYGADTVACMLDSSGSIQDRENDAYFAEVGAILQDVRPRKIIVIWCDHTVRRVEEVSTLGELEHIRMSKTDGGGGTDFRPPFKYLADHNIEPDVAIYLTDMEGTFPDKPEYDVIWCSTSKTNKQAPFGEHVRVVV